MRPNPLLALLLGCAPKTGSHSDSTYTETGADTACASTEWYADADGDGYGSGEAVTGCDEPEGYTAAGGDCDDSRADVHPGAGDTAGDGLDADCDGTDGISSDCDTGRVVYEGDLVFSGDEGAVEMAEFCELYNVVEGSVDFEDVPDVRGLACLCEVTGAVRVVWNHRMESLDGLQNLRRAGEINIGPNDAMTTFSGLDSLETVDGWLTPYGGAAQTELDGFPVLRTVGGRLAMGGLAADRITALPALESVGERLSITSMGPIREIAGFGSLTYAHRIYIHDIPSLESITGFGALLTVEEGLTLNGLPALEAIPQFPSLTAIGGELSMGGLDAIEVMEGPSNLRSLGAFGVGGLDRLTSIRGFAVGESIKGDFAVADCPLLTTVGGFDGLSRVGNLWLEDNPVLHDMSALSSLTSVDEYIHLEGAPAADLSGLSALATVGGSLWVRVAAGPTDLRGLSGLVSVGGDLVITDAHGLVSLSGLDNLRSVGNDASIVLNDQLADITGLHGIESVGDDLIVTDNPMLTDDQAYALRDAIGLENIGGYVVVMDNREP